MKRKKQSFGAFLIAIVVVAVIWVSVIKFFNYRYLRDRERIISKHATVLGVVMKKRSVKGYGADICYQVDGVKYEMSTSISRELYKKYEVGDTIRVAYEVLNPSNSLPESDIKEKPYKFLEF